MKPNYKNLSILLLITTAVFLLNAYTPMFRDDCDYGQAHTLKEIVKCQKDAYFNTNGRVISHAIVQIFAGITGKGIFNILNAIMYALCLFTVSKHAVGSSKKTGVFTLLLSFFLLWFLLPDLNMTNFMIAGNLNFLWATALVLSYVYLFMQHAAKQHKTLTLIPVMLFSLLASVK